MTDSERSLGDSMVVGNQGTLLGGVDLPVPPDAGPQSQQPLGDPRHDPGRGTAAVLFERELPFEGVDDALDPLPDRAQRAVTSRLILAIGAEQRGPQLADSCFQEAVGEALSQTMIWPSSNGLPSRSASATSASPSLGSARHQSTTRPSGVVSNRLPGEMPKNPTEKGRKRPQALVVARLLGQVGEEMAQPHHCETKPAMFGGTGEQDLGHRQTGQLRVGELGLAPGQPGWPTKQIVDGDVERDEQVVEISPASAGGATVTHARGASGRAVGTLDIPSICHAGHFSMLSLDSSQAPANLESVI